MRLSEAQKETIRQTEPNGALIRIGDLYGLVWYVAAETNRHRWQGRLVKEMRKMSPAEAARYLCAGAAVTDLDQVIVWTGDTVTGRTRRSVVEQLTAEALR